MNSFVLIRVTKSPYLFLIITCNVHCSIASVEIKAYTLWVLYLKGGINYNMTVYSMCQDWFRFSIIKWSTQNHYFCEESLFKWTCCYISSIDMMTCDIWTRTLFSTGTSITQCRTGKRPVVSVIHNRTFYRINSVCYRLYYALEIYIYILSLL